MTMDATIYHTNIWKSVKKLFVDGLTLPSTNIFFDDIVAEPAGISGNTWVCITVSDPIPGHVSRATLTIYMFSSEDSEGDDVIALRDDVMGLLEPGSFILYNTTVTPWVELGGVSVYPSFQSPKSRLTNKINMLYLENRLKWGSVW